MYRLFHFSMYVVFSGLFGCAATQGPKATTAFNDDLSQYRPMFEEVPFPEPEISLSDTLEVLAPSMDISNDLTAKLDTMIGVNQRQRYVKGYRLQLYYGGSRSTANDIAERVERDKNIEATLSYVQPNYVVKVGGFFSEFEAYSAYLELSSNYPQAIIIQEEIPLDDLSLFQLRK